MAFERRIDDFREVEPFILPALRDAMRVRCKRFAGPLGLMASPITVFSTVAWRNCRDLVGTEALRFMIRCFSCGEIEAGNEAEDKTCEVGRAKQVTERLTLFGGGVGGV